MNPQMFDILVRQLARGLSRRGALRLVAGALGGALVGGSGGRVRAQPCGFEGESCENQGCCEGLVCSADLACVVAAPVQSCGFELESCENQPCCEGLVCSVDLACVFPEPVATCGFEGESCENQGCCAGLVCSADLACVVPVETAACGAEGESCENRPCCDGLACTADLACAVSGSAGQCGFEGESCENQPCCAGLECGSGLTCVIAMGQVECGGEGESCENRPCCADLECGPDLACVVPLGQAACAFEGESCENQSCCEGLECSFDLACVTPAATCGLAGESCENQPCCDGYGCTADLACVALDETQQCGYEGQSCENRPCCDGLACSADLACVIPDPAAQCGYIQQSCAQQPCCENLACTGDLICIAPDPAAQCGYRGQSCENQPCCEGLECSFDLACVVAEVTPAASEQRAAPPPAQESREERRAARNRQRDAATGDAGGAGDTAAVTGGQAGTKADRGKKQRNTGASAETRQRLSAADLGLPELLVTVTSEGLQGPAELAAGRYLFTIVNETNVAALVQLMGVPEDWTRDRAAAVIAALHADNPAPDALTWMAEATFAGGGEALGSGEAQAVVDLPPGQWAVDNLYADALSGLKVTGELPDDLKRVKATAAVSAQETGAGFATASDGAVVAGPQLVRVRNQTGHPALIVPFRTEGALTAEEFLGTMTGLSRSAIFAAETTLPAGVAAEPASGLVSPGGTFWWQLDLEPGFHTLAWILPDRNTGSLLQAGLVAPIEVAAG